MTDSTDASRAIAKAFRPILTATEPVGVTPSSTSLCVPFPSRSLIMSCSMAKGGAGDLAGTTSAASGGDGARVGTTTPAGDSNGASNRTPASYHEVTGGDNLTPLSYHDCTSSPGDGIVPAPSLELKYAPPRKRAVVLKRSGRLRLRVASATTGAVRGVTGTNRRCGSAKPAASDASSSM